MTGETELHRQIHPTFVNDGRISSQAFVPTRKDEHKLSVYDGNQFTCEAAWRHFHDSRVGSSCGVCSVTVREAESIELPSRLDEEEHFKGHAVIDFCAHSNNQQLKKGKQLRAFAQARGWRVGGPP